MNRSQAIKEWRKRTKERAVEAFGGKCCICGYNKCVRALEFHHIDPSTKEFGVSCLTIKWTRIVEELKKCIMVCSNCHMEIEEGITEMPENPPIFDESFTEYKEGPLFDDCPICGKTKSITQITCSLQCGGKVRYKVDWDSIDLLALYEKIGTYTGVGRELGCSDNAVRKRILKLKERK